MTMHLSFHIFFEQDGLWLVSQQPSVIQGYQKGILTPNFMEFTRLYESLVSQVLFRVNPVDMSWKHNVCLQTVGSLFFVCLFFPSQHNEPMDSTDHQRNAMQLSVAMGNLTLVLKGERDLITDGSKGSY